MATESKVERILLKSSSRPTATVHGIILTLLSVQHVNPGNRQPYFDEVELRAESNGQTQHVLLRDRTVVLGVQLTLYSAGDAEGESGEREAVATIDVVPVP